MTRLILAGVLCLQAALSDAEFKKLHSELRRPKDGFWSIAWEVSVLEARERAEREKKPLFIAAHNGNPLGAT